MAAELEREFYGVRARISAPPEVLEQLSDRLPRVWTESRAQANDRSGRRPPSVELHLSLAERGEGRYRYLVVRDGVEMIKAPLEGALWHLEAQLQEQVAVRSPDKVYVHAGVVGFGDRAIVIPGESHSGKTTLVAALVRAGASYLSDEYAVLDEQGLVYPFAKLLSIRDDDGETHLHAVESLGGQVRASPLPIALVVMPRYRAGVVWQPTALSQGDAMLAVMRHTVQARERPASTLAALKAALDGTIAVQGERGEAAECATALLAILESGSGELRPAPDLPAPRRPSRR